MITSTQKWEVEDDTEIKLVGTKKSFQLEPFKGNVIFNNAKLKFINCVNH